VGFGKVEGLACSGRNLLAVYKLVFVPVVVLVWGSDGPVMMGC